MFSRAVFIFHLRLVLLMGTFVAGTDIVHAQTINTVAGNGSAGFNGDGSLAGASALNRPRGVAFDTSGNMYIADVLNHRVRRVSVTTQAITTVAGNGLAGFSGDGGAAGDAQLNQPQDVVVDASDTLYIADSSNHRIRKVTSAGIISTFAGTGTFGFNGDNIAAINAQLNRPTSIAIDASGNLFIADSSNQRIRKVTNGIITTAAGNGEQGYSGNSGLATAATLRFPVGVAVDTVGNLYIADAGNHVVRRVVVPTNIISTFAGNGIGAGTDTGSFSGDGGSATSAGLNTPEDVLLDTAGNLFIADMANYRIRKVSSSGTISTIAGTGVDGYSGDGGLAINAIFNLPWAVTMDAAGNLLISDMLNHRIRRISFIAASAAYYFPHLALGGGWQTTITYINYSSQTITCTTTFFSDSGSPLSVSFGGAAASSRTDTLAPGGAIHQETNAALNAPVVGGWARAQCSGPVKTSLLYRFYQQGVATGEAGVNAMTVPTTKFVTFAEQNTGVAYANPSTQSAAVTFTAFSSAGQNLASKSLTLLPGEHGAANLGPLLGLSSFTGSIQITSTVPIVSLSLNAEAFPAFSSLPPGELDGSTASYFPHLALGGGWQTSITYINSSSQTVTCTTTFFSDSGGPLSVSFGGAAASSRTDTLAPGGVIHQETNSALNAPAVGGWAQAQCSGPVKTSLLYRFYQQGVAVGEAGVNAMTASAIKFVTYADQNTGVAYANPSTQRAEITFTAISSTGTALATKSLPVLTGEHGAANVGPLLGLSSFTGSIQITSTVPIVSLSLNAEAFPAFSSLPPGELYGSTPLATNAANADFNHTGDRIDTPSAIISARFVVR